jgi:hypothetical protein
MDASRSLRGALAPRRKLYRRAIFAAATGSVSCVAALIACGGTTGREGLAGPDAGNDNGGFDATINYIDRVLPDLYVAPVDTGGAGDGGGTLNCAPDLPILVPIQAGMPQYDAAFTLNEDGATPSTAAPYEIPAVWLDDGGEAPAPDGSACATHVWLGFASCDLCLKQAYGGSSGNPWYGEYGNTAVLPPCSDMAEAGIAVAGPGANTPRINLCNAMLDCFLRTQCFAVGVSGTVGTAQACICNPGDDCTKLGPTGPCATEVQSAGEVQGSTPADTYQRTVRAFNVVVPPDQPGHASGSLGFMFSDIISGTAFSCVPFCTGDAGSQ